MPLDETDWGSDEARCSTDVPDGSGIPDRRLELMLVCAHPAIAASIRTPLMLQVVLGVDAAAIAAAFAVEPATMAQRLVRAKKRIRDTGIPFEMPEREQLAERLPAVLEAVYGAYAIDWQLVPQGSAGGIAVRRGRAPGTGARRPAPRRARGARPRGAGMPVGGPSARPARRGRMLRAARGAGHRPLGSRHDRPRRGAADARARPRPARPIPVRGGDPVRPLQPCHAWSGGRRDAAHPASRAGSDGSVAGRRGSPRGTRRRDRRPCGGIARPRCRDRPRRRTVPAGVGGAGASAGGGGPPRRGGRAATVARSKRRRIPASSNTSQRRLRAVPG